MVVLSCAVCTKTGKALVARQFVELSKARIEGLLAAFPKLMGTGKQHTFIETDSVRYLYQPLESLYMLVITNKNSNILEDLETLHLLAKLVPEYSHTLDESDVTKHAFDLIFAFDEVIAMGYKERVTLTQVKHFTTMESHEEERARAQQIAREKEAKAHAKQVSKILDDKKKNNPMPGMGGGMGGGSMGGGMSSSGGMGGGGFSESPQPFVVEKREERERDRAPVNKKPGMILGSKTKQSDLAKVLKEEKIVTKPEEIEEIVSGKAVVETKEEKQGPVHIVIEEQLTIVVENDGGLESLLINGGLSINTNDSSLSQVNVALTQGANKQFQVKTHPKIDRQAFASNSIIKAKDAGELIPSAVMKWRLQTQDENMLPLSVSCWPSPSGGQTHVTMEYELREAPGGELHNVSINVPVPGSAPPVVSKVEGHYDWEARSRTLVWKMPIIDESQATGSLEFSVPGNDPKGFFPLVVSFTAKKTFMDIQVDGVTNDGQPVRHTEVTSLSVEEFKIV